MNDIDLTEARPGLAILLTGYAHDVLTAGGVFDSDRTATCIDEVLTHAAPLIEAAVRAQVVREITALADASTVDPEMSDYTNGLDDAARIARGGEA